jgi:hypothetical protein
MDPADSPAPHRRWWLRIFATFLALLLLYALSIGPVIGYLQYRWSRDDGFNVSARQQEQRDRVSAFYRPIVSLVINTPLMQPVGAYVRWWESFFYRFRPKPEPGD